VDGQKGSVGGFRGDNIPVGGRRERPKPVDDRSVVQQGDPRGSRLEGREQHGPMPGGAKRMGRRSGHPVPRQRKKRKVPGKGVPQRGKATRRK